MFQRLDRVVDCLGEALLRCSYNFNDLVDGIGHRLLPVRTAMRTARLLCAY